MKNTVICLLLLLPFSFFNAQLYEFDQKCLNQSKRLKPRLREENPGKSTLFFNTKYSGYYMVQHKGTYHIINNDTSAGIHIWEMPGNKGVYQTTGSMPVNDSYSGFDIKRTTVQRTDELHYLVKTFPGVNSKRSNLEVKFILRKSISPLVQIKFMDLSPQIHRAVYVALLQGLDSPNYRIERAEVKYRSGYRFVYDFSSCEAATVRFTLSES